MTGEFCSLSQKRLVSTSNTKQIYFNKRQNANTIQNLTPNHLWIHGFKLTPTDSLVLVLHLLDHSCSLTAAHIEAAWYQKCVFNRLRMCKEVSVAGAACQSLNGSNFQRLNPTKPAGWGKEVFAENVFVKCEILPERSAAYRRNAAWRSVVVQSEDITP